MLYTAQHILQGLSQLPEDRYVNTFHFDTSDTDPTMPFETVANLIADRLEQFFDLTIVVGGSAISSFLARIFDESKVLVKVYRLSDPEPREPITIQYGMVNTTLGGAMASEVALCSSYYSGTNTPRNRGRVYIGPLKASAVDAPQGVPARPSLALRNTISSASKRLADHTTGPIWSTLSKAIPGVLSAGEITDGWVDDAFDTQRRRGAPSTTRTIWAKA